MFIVQHRSSSYCLILYLFIYLVPEAISVEVMMTLTENTMEGNGKE